MIAIVVPRLIKDAGFAHQIAVRIEAVVCDLQVFRSITGHIEVMFRRDFGSQREFLEVPAGQHWRIDEHVERDGFELNRIAGLRLLCERRAKFPTLGQRNGGSYRDRIGRRVRRVQHEFVPAQNREIRTGGRSGRKSGRRRGRKKIELRVEAAHTPRNIEMEGVHVDVIALPGERLPIRRKNNSGEVADGPGGAVLAGNPFGIDQRQGPRMNRNREMSVQNLSRRVRQVNRQIDLRKGKAGA